MRELKLSTAQFNEISCSWYSVTSQHSIKGYNIFILTLVNCHLQGKMV